MVFDETTAVQEVSEVFGSFGDDCDSESGGSQPPHEDQPLLQRTSKPRVWKVPKGFVLIEVGMYP